MNKNWQSILDNIKEGVDKKSEPNDNVLMIDSMNTFFRCFSIINHLNPNGDHIGGLTGFLKSIGYIIRLIRPSKVILVFDGKGSSTNKRYLYPDYKANRDVQTIRNWGFDNKEDEVEAMTSQLVRLVEYCQLLPVQLVSIDKIEADDVIGHLATRFPKNVTIMSADQDFLQLASDKIKIYSPTKKKFYTPKEVLEEYGVLVENFIYYKVLMGDKGDNVPGIRGLGEKKLFKLFPHIGKGAMDMDYIKELAETHKDENILFERIHAQFPQLEINFKLMNLSTPNIPEGDLETIENVIHNTNSVLNKPEFLKMYQEDQLNNSIPRVDMWLDDTFRYLTSYK
jgi:5'-3' exonuclease